MKKIAVFASFLLAAAMLTACGESSTDGPAFTPAQVPTDAPATEESVAEETYAEESFAEESDDEDSDDEESNEEESDAEDSGEASPDGPVMENLTGFTDLNSFSAETLDGGTWTEERLANADVTVINLWATFCGPCIAEMPEIAAFRETLPENVQLVTCCVDVYGDENRQEALNILSEAGYQGETLVNPSGDLQTLSDAMMYVPTTIFVDKDGHLLGEAIIGGGNVEENYTARINEILLAMGKDALN